MSDLLHVFVFEEIAVRGALVQLDATWRFVRSLHAHPPPIEALLGEGLVAAALLASTLKSGTENVLLQMQGEGPVTLLVAECSSDFGVRCTTRYSGAPFAGPLTALLGNGRCAITVSSVASARRYQGVVPLDAPTLAGVLESYMARSEQLDTRIVLHADSSAANGLLLQRIPERTDFDADAWNRVFHLAATVTADELRTLAAPTLLRRLFPEDDVRLFGGRTIRFQCSCSQARVGSMLQSLGRDEVEDILAEQAKVEVTCEFCGQGYTFGPAQCRALFD
jgi:molecular chaperone Hsp33